MLVSVLFVAVLIALFFLKTFSLLVLIAVVPIGPSLVVNVFVVLLLSFDWVSYRTSSVEPQFVFVSFSLKSSSLFQRYMYVYISSK